MPCSSLTEQLNKECFCVPIDNSGLDGKFDQLIGQPGFSAKLRQTHPHLFSNVATFVSERHVQSIQELITAVEKITQNEKFSASILSDNEDTTQLSPPQKSVFFSYDFHIDGPNLHLIEINTNAGGALLNAYLSETQRACCDALPLHSSMSESATIIAMFEQEWRLARGNQALRSIAIVDDTPEQQGLYPEFQLFEALFKSHGYQAFIAAPEQLTVKGGQVYFGEHPIDLIYNRLTDFFLAEPVHAQMKQIYMQNLAVITPYPKAYALFADKKVLAVLSNPQQLLSWGVAQADIELFNAYIPKTNLLTDFSEQELWANRKHYFFKPLHGFGSKATYRGDKLTKTTFARIIQERDYIVQEIAPLSERSVQLDGQTAALKFDLRVYAYDGKIQLLAARLYQGQTTNMRTPGGGFSPVLVIPSQLSCSENPP